MQAAAAPKTTSMPALKGAKSQARTQKGSAPSQSRVGSGSHRNSSTTSSSLKARGRDVQVSQEDGEGGMYGVATACKSAAISQLERDLAGLRTENASLKQELSQVKSLYEQLIHEAPLEKFQERRVHLLKSQLIQLERQVLLLSQALSNRAELLLELGNTLDSFLEKLSLLKVEDSSARDVSEIASKAKTMKRRLTKYAQASPAESLAQPLLFMGPFIRSQPYSCGLAPSEASSTRETVTLIDVCRGGTEHISLKHVSRLESKLAELYGALTELQVSLQTLPRKPLSTASLLQPMENHVDGHMTRSCKMIGECCHHLLCLSLLVPAAPWPPLKGTEVSLDFRVETVLGKLPSVVRNKKEAREAIEAAAKAFCYQKHMQEMQCRALEQELEFHRSVYDLQVGYVESLLQAMRSGYQTFEQSAQDLICKPIDDLLASYRELSETAGEEELRKFLLIFQENSDQLENAVKSFKTSVAHSQGTEALSHFGQRFFASLRELEETCSRRRQELAERRNPSADAHTS